MAHALPKFDNSREGVDDQKTAARGSRHQQAAVIRAEIEGAVDGIREIHAMGKSARRRRISQAIWNFAIVRYVIGPLRCAGAGQNMGLRLRRVTFAEIGGRHSVFGTQTSLSPLHRFPSVPVSS
jgi:hypothetical protein